MQSSPPPRKLELGLLTPEHDVRTFECGNPRLDEYLTKYASQQSRKGYGKTHVLTLQGNKEVLGFYTLSAGVIEPLYLPDSLKKKLPKHAMPVVHLGRLAVARKYQGCGFGKLLLIDCIYRAIAFEESIGVHAIEVVAKDEEARNFYLRFGFQTLTDGDLHLYLPMSTARALVPSLPLDS